jgi:DNA-binding NarL/FixJ family response regulator
MVNIRVSIVEDISDIREALCALIEQTAGFSLISSYVGGEEAVTALIRLQPDIVIMDINLPGMTGIECVRQVRNTVPHIQFMMFTVYDNDEQIFSALAAGATGYLLKKAPAHKIIEALRELYDGGSPMSASIARRVIGTFQARPPAHSTPDLGLTPREQEILDLLAKGLLYKEISDQLGTTTGTVKQQIHKIYEKLQVQNRTEAINKVFPK